MGKSKKRGEGKKMKDNKSFSWLIWVIIILIVLSVVGMSICIALTSKIEKLIIYTVYSFASMVLITVISICVIKQEYKKQKQDIDKEIIEKIMQK